MDWFPSKITTSHTFSMEAVAGDGKGEAGNEYDILVTLQTGDIEFQHVAYEVEVRVVFEPGDVGVKEGAEFGSRSEL